MKEQLKQSIENIKKTRQGLITYLNTKANQGDWADAAKVCVELATLDYELRFATETLDKLPDEAPTNAEQTDSVS